MEEIRQTALAYFNNFSDKKKKKVLKFIQKIDADKDGSISLDEYLKYLKKEGFPEISNAKVFEELDKDNNGCLDFEEAITLFYICASERPLFCCECQEYLKGTYFICSKCFDTSQSYDLCITCFQEKKHKHKHAVFCDNHALLLIESKKTTIKGKIKHFARHGVGASTIPVVLALVETSFATASCTIM